jgi:glycosyltransferase involved in cell wall biosynthesis
MKLLFAINSHIDDEWNLWKNNQKTQCPEHFLWGCTKLHKYGINVELLPYEKYSFLKKIGYKFRLGDIDQQLRMILTQAEYDMIYSSCQTSTILLSILRYFGLFKKPIVVKLERPFKNNFANKLIINFFAQGHDKILCLSKRLYNQLKDDFGVNEDRIELIEWGADLPSYDIEDIKKEINTQSQSDCNFVISTGGTSRDYNTLVKAFAEINYPLQIYCSGVSAPTVDNIPKNVSVHYSHPTEKNTLTFREILAEYDRSYAIAIPLNIPPEMADYSNSFGLTSLLDAMAIGKAVVITRNKQIDIDVEKERIGFWVETGDVNGWRQAINYLLEHPDETKEMGRRARYLCETKYNLETFSAKLADSLKKVLVQ